MALTGCSELNEGAQLLGSWTPPNGSQLKLLRQRSVVAFAEGSATLG